MNIKPGSVNQQPLYGCTGCYEDYTWPAWPAGDLRVYDNECWCGQCWAERRWLFPDQPYWDDLEPYTPAEQQPAPDVTALVEALEYAIGTLEDCDMNLFHNVIEVGRAALAAPRKGGEA